MAVGLAPTAIAGDIKIVGIIVIPSVARNSCFQQVI